MIIERSIRYEETDCSNTAVGMHGNVKYWDTGTGIRSRSGRNCNGDGNRNRADI